MTNGAVSVMIPVKTAYFRPFNDAPFPFVGQFLANLDRLQSLIDPTVGIALTMIIFQHTFDTLFRIVLSNGKKTGLFVHTKREL